MLHKNIKKLREQRCWSQSELARQAGLTSACISLLEKGDKNPSLRTIKLLSDAFKITTDDLCASNINNEDNQNTTFSSKFNILNKLSLSDQKLILQIAERLIK